MDNTVLNPGVGGDTIATDDIGGVKHELVKVEFGVDGSATMVSAADPLPVTNAAAEVSLASIDVKLSNPLATTGGLTDTELRATPVPVSGVVTSITNNVNTIEVAPTTVFNGKTTVTVATTRVVLAASQAVKSVTIKALSTNTGFIYVGNATVAAANGFQLQAGDSISFDIANLNTVNIDASVSGEGVTYLGIN